MENTEGQNWMSSFSAGCVCALTSVSSAPVRCCASSLSSWWLSGKACLTFERWIFIINGFHRRHVGTGRVSVKSESEIAQSGPTLCDPVGCSPPGSSVHGVLQGRILEWGAISFSSGSSWPRDRIKKSEWITGQEAPGDVFQHLHCQQIFSNLSDSCDDNIYSVTVCSLCYILWIMQLLFQKICYSTNLRLFVCILLQVLQELEKRRCVKL